MALNPAKLRSSKSSKLAKRKSTPMPKMSVKKNVQPALKEDTETLIVALKS